MALDLLADDNPKAKGAKPEDFIDNRFIKELDDSGYYRQSIKGPSRAEAVNAVERSLNDLRNRFARGFASIDQA